MPKMLQVGDRLGRLSHRLERTGGGDERKRSRQRRTTEPWRAWYNLARWQRLKRETHERDGYMCQATGELCIGEGNEPNAPICDHVKPHNGDPELFWDPKNLQTVTKRYHDSVKQSLERNA